ncbi:MAG: hypothetical protein GY855_04970 [candidate division Zixibacteria bacterium]|nr:hypothetical protein [candidate division Zixibacteria bacterium]
MRTGKKQMNYFTILYLTIALMISPSIAFTTDIQTADSLFDVFQYDEAAEIYRDLISVDSSDSDLLLKFGECLIYFAELEPEENQLVIYEEAGIVLKKSAKMESNNAEVHFQIAKNQGRIALFKGIWSSIGLAKEVKREAETALEINPEHDGALHILGRWHREASNKSKIIRTPLGLGAANKEDAIKFLEQAVTLKPDYINHHLELGKTYMAVKRYPEARHQFYTVTSFQPVRPIEKKYIKEAKELLAELEGKS